MIQRKEPEYAETNWFTATGEEDGKPLVFRGRQELPIGVVESGYPMLSIVNWPYGPANDKGMPDKKTNIAQVEFEDAVADLDSPGLSILMLVVTGNGRKAWHWYVSDIEAWMNKFNRLLAAYPVFPIDIEHRYEPDWALYHNFISGVEGL